MTINMLSRASLTARRTGMARLLHPPWWPRHRAADPPEPEEHPGHLVIYDEDDDGQDHPVDDERAVTS